MSPKQIRPFDYLFELKRINKDETQNLSFMLVCCISCGNSDRIRANRAIISGNLYFERTNNSLHEWFFPSFLFFR